MTELEKITIGQIGFGRACINFFDSPPTYETGESFLRRIYIKFLRGHYSSLIEFEDGLVMGIDGSYIK